MDENDISVFMEKLINGIGAISEISLLFFKSCLKSGATMEEASALTKIFLQTMIESTGKKETGE